MMRSPGGATGTAAITGGTIDGAVIGGTSAAAITGTTITATTQFNVGTSGTVLAESGPGVLLMRGLTANNQLDVRRFGLNGAYTQWGSSSELLTLSTSGTTTDTAANLLPVDSLIEAVCGRVTTTITTATDWKLGDATIAGRFSAANSVMTAGSTSVGTVCADQTGTSGPRQTAAAKVRVTTTGTPGAGVIRICAFYRQFIAPTS